MVCGKCISKSWFIFFIVSFVQPPSNMLQVLSIYFGGILQSSSPPSDGQNSPRKTQLQLLLWRGRVGYFTAWCAIKIRQRPNFVQSSGVGAASLKLGHTKMRPTLKNPLRPVLPQGSIDLRCSKQHRLHLPSQFGVWAMQKTSNPSLLVEISTRVRAIIEREIDLPSLASIPCIYSMCACTNFFSELSTPLVSMCRLLLCSHRI